MGRRVLVVGAGPAGLVAALGLAQRSVGVQIVDQAAGPVPGSRAKGLQPRTLEVFEALGVVDEVLSAGGRFPRWRSYRAGRLDWERSIYELLGIDQPAAGPGVPYPETWMIPQWRTEEILRSALSRHGIQVEYGRPLTGFDVDQEGVTATIGAGRERLRADYIVAADGAASVARKRLGVSFEGVTRDDERFVIADIRTPDLDRTYWHNWSDPDDVTARVSVCPLPGTDTFQFVAPLPPDRPAPALTLTTVQRLFDERAGGARARFTGAPWIILHRSNERLARRFAVDRVFLAGDAADAVPASGGQGLNGAVQDAHNLAWKLSAVLRGAPARLLESYEEERRPISARLMAGSRTAAAEGDRNGDEPDIFQLRTNYRGRSLSQETRRSPGPLRAGDRAPDGPLWLAGGSERRLFELMRRTDFVCVAFGDAAVRACRAVVRGRGYPGVGVLDVRRSSPATAETIQTLYGAAVDDVVFLVRPDGYIGLTADEDIATRLDRYLSPLLPGSAT